MTHRKIIVLNDSLFVSAVSSDTIELTDNPDNAYAIRVSDVPDVIARIEAICENSGMKRTKIEVISRSSFKPDKYLKRWA